MNKNNKMRNIPSITEDEMCQILSQFFRNCNGNKDDFRVAIQKSRGQISQEAEIAVTHAWLDNV